MATLKQIKAVDKLVENRGTSISGAMREAGYDDTTAKNPKNLTDSIGFMELCEEKGLTDTLLLDALVDDIKTKKRNRLGEITLGLKVKGRLKEESGNVFNAPVQIVIKHADEGSNPPR